MGGDYGIPVSIAACVMVLKKHKNVQVLLFGPAKVLSLKISSLPSSIKNRIVVCNASQTILMSDTVAQAKQKNNSSMFLALEALVSGRVDAFVTAGNTAAVTSLAKDLVPMCQGVSKPALFSEIPTVGKPTYMLDLGANLEADAQTLVEFTFLGYFCAEVVSKSKYPKVALLNVGKEDEKGTKSVRKAHEYLKRTTLNYHGFIEGDTLFKNNIDVVVCDGKTGNIALKTAEGAVNLMATRIKETLFASKLTSVMAMPTIAMLKNLGKELDPNRYNGSILLGHTKIIAKSHGGSNAYGLANAIELSIKTSKFNLASKITEGFKRYELLHLQEKGSEF